MSCYIYTNNQYQNCASYQKHGCLACRYCSGNTGTISKPDKTYYIARLYSQGTGYYTGIVYIGENFEEALVAVRSSHAKNPYQENYRPGDGCIVLYQQDGKALYAWRYRNGKCEQEYTEEFAYIQS